MDSTPSVSSEIEEMLPEMFEMPALEKTNEADNDGNDAYDADDEYTYDFRRISIYSEDGQDSFTLASYTNSYGTKRIMLNDVDISLKDFRRYLKCISQSESNRHNELFYVGIQSSFITGIVVLLVALGLAFMKNYLATISGLSKN
jgi:hypothetical protein